jgi:hypothetical protein
MDMTEQRDVRSEVRPLDSPSRASALTQARSAAIGAVAIGALALGATAIGALAIGRLAVRFLAVRRGHLRTLAIDELLVGRLHVRELVVEREERPSSELERESS